MMMTTRLVRLVALASILAAAACSGSGGSPTAPSTPSVPIVQPPQTYTVTGRVTAGASGLGINGASVSIVDGVNAGKSAITDSTGRYTIPGLAFAGMTASMTAPGWITASKAVILTQGVTTATLDWTTLPTVVWGRSGLGDNAFDIPPYVTRVQIVGDYSGYTSNFIVRVDGRLVVNELLGTGWGRTHFQGIYVVSGTLVQITNSSGVRWSIAEAR